MGGQLLEEILSEENGSWAKLSRQLGHWLWSHLGEGAFKGYGGSLGGVQAAVTGLQDWEERLAPRLTEDAAWWRVRDTGHIKNLQQCRKLKII